MKNTTKTPSQIILAILALLAFALPSPAWGQTYTLAPSPHLIALNNSGTIINAGCIWTYLTGTSTEAATYTTSSGTQNPNPIIASSSGRFVAFLQPGTVYRFVYEDTPCSASSHGTVLATRDGIAAVPTSGLNVDVTGTAGETLTLADLVYLSDGSGGLDAGEWYRADADTTYSSSAATIIGFATAAASANATVTVRIAGRMTGLSLAAGSIYYASATAAALTSTRPANAACVGEADSTTTLVLPCGPRADTGSSMALLRANSGTSTAAGATNVDTVAISGLTALDTLFIYYTVESITQATAGAMFYNNTDAVLMEEVNGRAATIVSGGVLIGHAQIMQSQNAATRVFTRTSDINFGVADTTPLGAARASTFTTNWTGSWTLALRHDGVTAGGTFRWSWSVYVVRGQ